MVGLCLPLVIIGLIDLSKTGGVAIAPLNLSNGEVLPENCLFSLLRFFEELFGVMIDDPFLTL